MQITFAIGHPQHAHMARQEHAGISACELFVGGPPGREFAIHSSLDS